MPNSNLHLDNLYSKASGLGISVDELIALHDKMGKSGKLVPDYTALSSIATSALSSGDVYLVSDAQRGGLFAWSADDHSVDVSNDPLQGLWIAPESDTSGASGAWQRSYNDKGYLDVRWFGAALDGSDEGDILIAAATLAAADAQRVYIPKGVLGINGQIDIFNGFKLEGAGIDDTEIRLLSDNGLRMFDGVGVSDVSFKNLTINPQADVFTSTRTVVQINFYEVSPRAENIEFVRVGIPGATSAGIVVGYTNHVIFERNRINDTRLGDCIRSHKCEYVKFEANTFDQLNNLSNDRRVIQAGGCKFVELHSNTISNVANSFAYDFGGSVQIAMTNEVCRNVFALVDFENGTNVFTASSCIFGGRNVNDSAAYGVMAIENPQGSSSLNITFTGCQFSGFYRGIRADAVVGLTVSGCTIREMFAEGVSIQPGQLSGIASDHITIVGNTILNCSKAGVSGRDAIEVNATRGVISSNVIMGANHKSDIQTGANNTAVIVFGNLANKVTRNESFVFTTLSSHRIYEIDSTPEGIINSSAGSICLTKAGEVYRKTTATGVTGWVKM